MSLFKRFPPLAILVCALVANAQTPDGKTTTPLSSALDSGLFYQLLLGELNAREGDPGAGFSLILDAARKTNDARLYQRAVDIAIQARSGDSALMAARAWRLAQPTSREANRYVLQILIGLNRIAETLDPLKREVAAADAQERAAVVAAIPRYFARATDKQLAASTVERALNGYLTTAPVSVSAWTVIGYMRFAAGDTNGAVEAAHTAQTLDAKSEAPAVLALSMMKARTPQAEDIVKRYLEGQALPEVRMGYVRALLDAQRYPEAQAQLKLLTSEHPDYAEAWLIQGALELQDDKLNIAEQSLKKYVDMVTAQSDLSRAAAAPGVVRAYIFLAQIAEKRKDFSEADAWLKRIDNPEEQFNVQLQRAGLLARQGKLEDALALIRSQPEDSPAQARLKLTAQVQLFRDSKQYQAAYDLLVQATSDSPDDFDLVYDKAMLAERLGKLDEMEQLLREVIAAKPEYPHAYNALGYSLAERNIRLPEARQLVLKALEYAPDDPFIADSLGWVEFRSGNLPEALRILEGAFKTKPDAEIAAHLGEVLWSMGLHDRATEAWKEGLRINGKNETLLGTLKRLKIKL